tara:strand:+ start:773 stop:1528 length:756 start_codon:yes stop_codon:yes gene_type:complete
MGILYFVQPSELVGTNRYKIGCSKKSTLERVKKGYRNGTRYLHIMECDDSMRIEKLIKQVFNETFILIAGTEYFEGDEEEMKTLFYNKYIEYSSTNEKKVIKKPKRQATEKQLESLRKAREIKKQKEEERKFAKKQREDEDEYAEFMRNYNEYDRRLYISMFVNKDNLYPGCETIKQYIKEIKELDDKERKEREEKEKKERIRESKIKYYEEIGLDNMTKEQKQFYFEIKGFDNLTKEEKVSYYTYAMFGH